MQIKGLFGWKLVFLIPALIQIFFIGNIELSVLGVCTYIFFVLYNYNKNISAENPIFIIKKLCEECDKRAESAMNSTNSEKRFRIRTVIKDKNEIRDILNKDKSRLLKQKIAKQAMELVLVYIELLENFYIRKKDFDNIKFEDIEKRIELNEQKIQELTNLDEKQQIEDVLDLDKKLLDRLLDEKKELENISSKLEYIETSMSLLKQQMLSSIDGQEVMDNVQNVVNEVTALNSAISNVKKEKQKL